MQIKSFFKTLNNKINTYDKLASNPFEASKRLVIVWVEDNVPQKTERKNE